MDSAPKEGGREAPPSARGSGRYKGLSLLDLRQAKVVRLPMHRILPLPVRMCRLAALVRILIFSR